MKSTIKMTSDADSSDIGDGDNKQPDKVNLHQICSKEILILKLKQQKLVLKKNENYQRTLKSTKKNQKKKIQ